MQQDIMYVVWVHTLYDTPSKTYGPYFTLGAAREIADKFHSLKVYIQPIMVMGDKP